MKRGMTTFKKTHNATFLCLSNSNTFYIDTILKATLLRLPCA
jgi:hypothetical protein